MRKLITLLSILIFTNTAIKSQIILSNDTSAVCNTFTHTLQAVSAIPTTITTDDAHSPVVPIGFDFDFYGTTYNSVVVSGNGYLSFDLSLAGTGSPWTITATIPNPGSVPENAILAPWQDTNPGLGGEVTYATIGTAPNRVFLVTWCEVPMFQCATDLHTSQIALYEGSNKIEMYIENKPLCAAWNGGAAIQGLVSPNSTNSDIVTDPASGLARNFPLQWTATNEGWEFLPNTPTSYTINSITYTQIIAGVVNWYGPNTLPPANYLGSGPSLPIFINTTGSFTYYAQINGGCSPVSLVDNVTVNFDVSCCDYAGDDNTADVCNTNSPINLFTYLNNAPSTSGFWEDPSGNTVSAINTYMLDPSTDPDGVYSYIIAATANCAADTGFVTVSFTPPPALQITSPSPLIGCSEVDIPLTGNQPGAIFSGANLTGNIFNSSTIGPNTITYTHTVPGCTTTVDFILTVNESPTVLPTDINTVNPGCAGDANGTAQISPTGGTGPGTYTYSWNTTPVQLTQTATGLSAGNLSYTVTDANTCVFVSSIDIYDPTENTQLLTAYNSSCYAENDGSIGITMNSPSTPSGTVSTLAYCASSPNLTFAAGGAIIESVKLTGDNNDIDKNTAGIADTYLNYTMNSGLAGEYADITENQQYWVDVVLNGINGGGSTADLSGGKVYIDFNIDGDFTDPEEEIGLIPYRTNASLGIPHSISFIVPVTGVYGATRMRVVSQNLPSANSSGIGPCDFPTGNDNPWKGATEDYSIVLNAPDFNNTSIFNWAHDGSNVDSATNLSPGKYFVTITSLVGGCIVEDSAEVLEPAQFFFNADVTNILCHGDATGQISLSPSGGNGGGYNYSWDTSPATGVFGGNNALVSNLDSDSYKCTISDPTTITPTNPIACADDTTIIIIEPPAFNVDFTTSDSEICLNDPAVTLDFNFNQGGTAPFTIVYTANGNQSNIPPINNSGTASIPVNPTIDTEYIITNITDIEGCNPNNIINPQYIDVNPLPDINITVDPKAICIGDSAALLFSPTGVADPYLVKYFDGSIDKIDTAGLSIWVKPTNTTTYRLIRVTDDNGCESDLTDSVTLVVNEIPEVTFLTPTETCENEKFLLQFDFTAGSAPWIINYSLDGNPFTFSMESSGSIEMSLNSSTVFTLDSITDDNLCKNDIEETVTITTHSLPEITLSGGGSLCADGSTTDITFTTTSGTPPYNLTYSAGLNPNFVSDIGNIYTISTFQSGIYTIENLIDSKGCKATSISGSAQVFINPLPEANITAYPTKTTISTPLITFIDMSNGHTNGYWDFADGEIEISNLGKIYHTYKDTGIYQVSLNIESDSGCTNIAWQTIIISPLISVYIPNAFSPNNDLTNDLFLPVVNGAKEYEFSIYDRQGERIFTTNQTDVGWDGKVKNGDYALKGVYIYALVLTDINGKLRTYEGSVALIR